MEIKGLVRNDNIASQKFDILNEILMRNGQIMTPNHILNVWW